MSVKIVLALCLFTKTVVALGDGSDPILVNSCCPFGQELNLYKNPNRHRFGGLFEPEILAKCVRKHSYASPRIEKRVLQLVDLVEDENGTMSHSEMNVSFTGIQMPTCTMGLKISFIANHSKAEDACKTNSGDSSNKQCIFPFTFNNVVYNECTWTKSSLTNNKPWCSTKVDENGIHISGEGYWGNCAPDCPVELNLETSMVNLTSSIEYEEVSSGEAYPSEEYEDVYYSDYYEDEVEEIIPKVSALKDPDCYEVKNNHRLWTDDVFRLHEGDGEWDEIPDLTMSECENKAKDNPVYIGWTYSDGWGKGYCYLMTKIRETEQHDSFTSGLVKDSCEHQRGKSIFIFLFSCFILVRRSLYYDNPVDRVRVTEDGQLVLSNMKFDSSQFCLTDQWKMDEDNTKSRDIEYVAVGLSCEPCKMKVFCLLISKFYEALSDESGDIKINKRNRPFYENIVNVADRNGNQEVSLDEFKKQIESYLNILLTSHDDNNDSFVEKPILNLQLILTVVNTTFEFLDRNEDEIISGEDFTEKRQGEKFKLSRGLISLPSPIFVLYSIIDPDRNEELSLIEVTEFITTLFHILDRNDDCSIVLDEVIKTLADAKLPADYQLAVRLFAERYLNFASFFIKHLTEITDKNKDNKMTLDELKEFSDFSLLDPMINVALLMTEYSSGPFNYMLGTTRTQERAEVLDLWLTTLQNLLMHFKKQPEPNINNC